MGRPESLALRRAWDGVSDGQTGRFHLIELLVVIAIIALLVSLLMPSLKQAKELSRAAVCKAHVRLVGVAIPQYLNDWDDLLPHYGDWIPRSQFASKGIDDSNFTPPDPPVRSVIRYALITTWQTAFIDPVRNGDGFYAPYLTNSKGGKVNLLGCPSVRDELEAKYYTRGGIPRECWIERGKTFCINFSQVTLIRNDSSYPLPITKVPRPSELVYMADAPGRAAHFNLWYEDQWEDWEADIPAERHFGEFNMVFVDGHTDTRPRIGTYPEPYFFRE